MDIIPMVIITILCIFVYQVLLCLAYTTIHIPITLEYLSIANSLFGIGLAMLIFKRGVQSFAFSKRDGMITLVLILFISIIAYQDVGKITNIRYFSTDASIHYIGAREFYENDKMLHKTENTETDKQMMPMAYVNVGILFKAFAPVISEINLYKIFLLVDITIFCFSGILFYFILKNRIKQKSHQIIAVMMTMLYLMGYPLNNLLSGFYYLGIGCLTINAILYIMEVQELKEGAKRLLLCLLNTGLILSYALFAPVVYGSMFLYYLFTERKKIKQIVLDTILTLVIPGFIGVMFLLVPAIEKVKYIAVDGYIYDCFWINIMFFIPFTSYYIYQKGKKKETDYSFLYFVVLISYMIILFVGTKMKMVSTYYFYKNAYILWAILLIGFFEGIEMLIGKEEKIRREITISYLILYVCFVGIYAYSSVNFDKVKDVYLYNYQLIRERENLTEDDINMLAYIDKNKILNKTQNNVLFVGDFMQEAWIRSMFTYRNRTPLEAGNHYEYIKKWNEGKIPYLVCFENSKIYHKMKDWIEVEKEKIVFQTKYATLYKQ